MKRKVIALFLLTMALGVASGCGSEKNPVSETGSTVNESVSGTVEEPSEEVPSRPVITEPDYSEVFDTVEIPETLKPLTFSGNANDLFKTEEYSVYEGEKYILLVDKGVELPGNYVLMLDAVLGKVEEYSGLSIAAPKKDFSQHMVPTKDGETPFAGLKAGDKMIIQLNAGKDYGDGEVTSYETEPATIQLGYITVRDRALLTFPNQKIEEADFSQMIDVFVRYTFEQYYPILTGDPGFTYLRDVILGDMAERYTDMKRVSFNTDYIDAPLALEADAVEKSWVDLVDWEDWSKRYSFSINFFKYMYDTQGKDFTTALLGKDYNDSVMTRAEIAERMKEKLGDDVFEKYSAWATNNSGEKAEALELDSTLTGFFHADKNYYVEGENCFVYIEKDANVPYDYVEKADKIVKVLKEEMWGSNANVWFEDGESCVSNKFYGLSNKGKLPITVCVDEENLHLISHCAGVSVSIYDYGMEKEDLSMVEYQTLAHECSHAVMFANGEQEKIGKIMTEGSADYYAEVALNKLQMEGGEPGQFYTYETPINAETAEKLFFNDFADVSHANRGVEYYYGYYLSKYLNEVHGKDFLRDVTVLLKDANISGAGSNEDRTNRVNVFKTAFGENVFSEFGKWYTTNVNE